MSKKKEGLDRNVFNKTILGLPLVPTALWGGGAVAITAATLLTYNFLPADDGAEKPPVQYGPVSIGVKKQIIDKRYPERLGFHLGISVEERKKTLPIFFAIVTGRIEIFEKFLQSSEEGFDAIAIVDPTLEKYRSQFLKDFPEKFTMSEEFKRNILYAFQAIFDSKQHISEARFVNMCKALVKNGADPFILISDPDIQPEAFRMLIDLMPNPADPVHYPIYNLLLKDRNEENWEKVKYAIDHGIDVNKLPPKGVTNLGPVIHQLIANEAFDDALKFIKMAGKKLDPSVCDEEGKNALIIAAKVMSTDVVKEILAQQQVKGDWINAQDKEGRTALHYACAYGLKGMAEALLDAGADPKIKDNKLLTPGEYIGKPLNDIKPILDSIEISYQRDKGAIWNAIVTSEFTPFGDKDQKAILATKENMEKNYDDMVRAIKEHANGNADLEKKDLNMLDKQKGLLQGESLWHAIHKRYREVEALFNERNLSVRGR